MNACTHDDAHHTDPVPLHRLRVPPPQVPPFAMGSFESLGPDSRAGYPHRHTFYEIVYVTGGSGTHVIDLVRRPLHPPHLCVLLPGQVHYWEAASDLSGVLMLFTEDFLLTRPGDRHLLRALGERSWLRLPPGPTAGPGEDAAGIGTLVRSMERECTAKADGYASVLEAYLHILLVRALRLPAAREHGTATGGRDGRAAEVARTFGLLLAESAGAEGSVGAYAARLGVSVGHLNEVVKQATGRTPGELVRAARLLEAKRLLTGSGLAVGQVARRVGFTDPAYFCRFFRRETGISPGTFRRAASGAAADE
ncbi:helix-turn-helix transcriptional regulator [Streptomyces griseocarneus]|uniref:helix-turn-helix transcriptional regulator n=1 Tax=Streptomyces griseocarneus TaxID=51201 RepID=UPI00167EE803|nr:AraC family transcriptional regulator [Streptomyces griseocarneus]MBZ6475494.1 AraC family transcriptional regulator [Streptomyces griseocarneus]GHG75606.1 AraC family transcriptional regulator [Streptomyces griseocarneus]